MGRDRWRRTAPLAGGRALSRRLALVTGAASGIGLEIARRLAASGARVLLTDRSDTVHASASAIGQTDTPSFVADLECSDQVEALIAHAASMLGTVDILVNNAAVDPKRDGAPFATADITLALWTQVIQVNLNAPFLLSRALLPGMRAAGWGRIVNIASRAGRTYLPNASLCYATTKAGLIGMTRQLAGEMASCNVTVNCVAPGPVDTPLFRQVAETVAAKLRAAIPAGRVGTATEIAATVEFLASDTASFITGACIDVNGGAFMG